MTVVFTLPKDQRTNRPLLESCLEDDPAAVTRLLKLLGHPTPELRHAYQDAIRQANKTRLWRGLISILADRCWETSQDQPQPIQQLHPDLEHQLRIDEGILDLLASDHTPAESPQKTAALRDCARSHSVQQRYIAHYLLVSRGDYTALDNLKSLFPQASLEWQLRMVRLLANLNTTEGGPLLIEALSSSNRILHHAAHRALIEQGKYATDAWITALQHPDSHIRWHAARGLGEMGDLRAIAILAAGLRDENAAVRWATSGLLARMGSRAVPAILHEISRKPLDEPARQAAYHALHGMSGHDLSARLAPILDALHGPGSDLLAPSTAQKLLARWEELPESAAQIDQT
ncbi:MAG TPA: HEAT repeat domain-containing protein [Anaerolineales bacterium]|nr:HEAT repeat domain-containing protein [Anaerolineales bacterium]